MNDARGISAKLLLIGLDAAEPRLIEQWTDEGLLPNLQKLRQGAAYGRLKSSADWLAGSPWPSFYTGTPPGEHGLYHAMQWRAEKMAVERPAPDWLAMTPFWRALPDAGRKVVALDMPMTYAPETTAPEQTAGREICGWATHDLLAPPAAQPAELMTWAEGVVGPPLISDEVYGPQKVQHLLKLGDELTAATAQLTDLARSMMAEFPWDLFAVGFGALHRGGHKLWDQTGTLGEPGEAEARQFSQALRGLYIACDGAIGALLEGLDPDTSVLIFSLHGMGPNTSRVDLLPEMLRRILAHGSAAAEGPPAAPGLLKRLRGAVPIEWRSAVKNRLPQPLQDRLTSFWRLGGTDWSKTEAFAAIADLQGYIRISVKGREAAGMVEPGPAYESLCRRIEEGLKTFVNAETGEAVVADVKRSREIYAEGSRLERLPDLLLRWAQTPAAAQRSIVSDSFGNIAWPTPGINPDGRSGNHLPEGFYLLKGPAVDRRSFREGGDILDLAPTIYQLMNLAPPKQMQGRPLFELQET